MAKSALVQLVPNADGKWTANVQGVPEPGMADALRSLADQIESAERSELAKRGGEALQAIHAAQEAHPALSDDEVDAEVRAVRAARRAPAAR